MSQLGSSSVTSHFAISYEALLAEASRYPNSFPSSLDSLGIGFLSSSSTSNLVRVVEVWSNPIFCGGLEERGGEDTHRLLRIVLADGRSMGCLAHEELELVKTRGGQEGQTEEEGTFSESRSSNCLAQFSNFLGLPIEGFKGEILTLFRKLKLKKELKAQMAGKRSKNGASKGDEEVRVLCNLQKKRF